MKLLVTGATGYLGEAVIRSALEQGYSIRSLCRTPPSTDSLLTKTDIVHGDLLNAGSLRAAMQGIDAVLHCAALVSIWQRNPQDFYRVNVEGTQNVIQVAFDQGVQRLVYTSSFFALGPTDEKPADETWNHPDETCMTDYAKSKYQALCKVREWIQQGCNIIPVYPVLIYGPGKPTQGNYITKLVDDFIHRKVPGVLGHGNGRWTYSYIEDVAKGHLLALEKGKAGEDYILGGEEATLNELFDLLQEITGVKRPQVKIPFAVAKGIACMEEIRARWSTNYLPKLTRDVVEVYKHHWRYSSQKAITELGYTRTPLKAGLLKILDALGFQHPGEHTTIL